MDVNIKQVIGAGGLAAAIKVLWKFARKKPATSPEEMQLREAVAFLKHTSEVQARTVARIELLVSDLPEIREQLARHDATLTHLRNAGDAMRFDILQLRQDAEERDAKIERIRRRLDARD